MVSVTAFELPLRDPFRTATGEFSSRAGLVLRVETDSDIFGLGEASPHPALGGEALPRLLRAFERVRPRLVASDIDELSELARDLPPALACAIDTAACDARARARGVSVARLLSDRVSPSVLVNATIAVEDLADAVAQAAAAREAGFTCVKLKVGMADDIEAERARVGGVREAIGSEVALRLDANGAWDTTRAVETVRALEEFDLEFVEQPVAGGDLDGLARVQREVGTLIAADEAITSLESARRVLDRDAARAIVIKPMVVGGVRPAVKIAEMALQAGVTPVVTTTVDAGIGVAAALHVAATLPPGGPACGLATASLLSADIVSKPIPVVAGRMALPAGPGLGVELDEAALVRHGTSREAAS